MAFTFRVYRDSGIWDAFGSSTDEFSAEDFARAHFAKAIEAIPSYLVFFATSPNACDVTIAATGKRVARILRRNEATGG